MADATIPIPKLQRIFLVDGGIKGLIKRVNCNAAALALISRERRRGLFASYSDMAAWFDMKRFDSATGLSSALWKCADPLSVVKVRCVSALVLRHMDLHMLNILMDWQATLWLIDWE
ncbi:hypothetical protein BKA70DRAFT_1235866 [Coprinopsis sp. MPI-PUGE-AT-0042]|nr:hypothetical protein BKA70DRAFT_1235866 [Coprinopsis sp. MPI-PUGE-AT-0042]